MRSKKDITKSRFGKKFLSSYVIALMLVSSFSMLFFDTATAAEQTPNQISVAQSLQHVTIGETFYTDINVNVNWAINNVSINQVDFTPPGKINYTSTEQGNLFGETQLWQDPEGGGQINNATLGRFYNSDHPEYGSPHSSSDGVYTEGLAYAYEIADMIDDEYHKEKYSNATALGVHNLISLQYTESNTGSLLYPEKVIGAIKYRIDDDRIRVDTTQHTIDAYMKILLVFS